MGAVEDCSEPTPCAPSRTQQYLRCWLSGLARLRVGSLSVASWGHLQDLEAVAWAAVPSPGLGCPTLLPGL